MPRAACSDRSSDVVPPFPPLAAPCTPPTPVGFCSLMSAASRRLTVPEDKETGGSFAVGQEAPRKPPPGTTDWFSSFQGGAGALHPPPRHLHWGAAHLSTCSTPRPCPRLHHFTQRQKERAFSFRSTCFFLPFSLPWKLLFLHLSGQLWSWGKRGKRPRQGGHSLIPS